MAEWELHDGEKVHGPFTEEWVIEAIGNRLKSTTLIRPVGAQKWKNLTAHAPFAAALEKKAQAEVPPPLAPPQPSPPLQNQAGLRAWWARQDAATRGVIGFGAAGAVVILLVLLGVSLFGRSKQPTSISCEHALVEASEYIRIKDWSRARWRLDVANMTCDSSHGASIQALRERLAVLEADDIRPQKPDTSPPAAATTSPVLRDGWAVIPKPGTGVPDTEANRVSYIDNVSKRFPGEPPLQKAKAQAVMQKMRTALAKGSGVNASAISVKVGESAAAITVADGVYADLDVGGTEMTFGACSEPYLGLALIDVTLEALRDAGVRAIVCTAPGCSAVFDARPTAPGGGLYGGGKCISLQQMVNLAGQGR
jgi:uncharacterized protein (DUF2267 family)